MLKRKFITTITILTLIALAILGLYVNIPWWSYLLVILSWFLITLFGSFFIQWNYHLTSLHANTAILKRKVALTFDDGPHPEFTPQVLDLLKKHNAKATFFCIGQEVEKYPELVKRIISEGHTLGNHTYSHSKNFGFNPTSKVIAELQQATKIIQTVTGKEIKLYRPAFGVTNPMIEKAVKSLKLTSIGWNVRSLDTTSRSETVVLKRITDKVDKGAIVLLHDTSNKSVAVLEQLLLFLQEKKLVSVTVDQLLEIEPYA